MVKHISPDQVRCFATASSIPTDQRYHNTSEWFIDSGASDHFTGSNKSFISFEEISPFPITLGDDSVVYVTGKGTLKLNLDNGQILHLKDVLYSPHFGDNNLLSIPKFATVGCTVTFQDHRVFIRDGNDSIASGTLCPKAGLYALDQRSSMALKVLKKPHTESLELWHRRYGHINYGYIRETAHTVSGLHFSSTKVESPCDPCELGKSTRSSIYPKEDPPGVLDILTIDIWGPAQVVSLTGNTYFINIKTKAGKYVTVKFLTDRKSFFEALIEVIAYLETQTGLKVKQIRLDGAPEFRSKRMDSWAKKRGTLLAFTTFYTPEQNASERGMRTIANAMRSMLVDSGLPQEFWEEAAATSVYLANRSFNPKVSMTPFEALYGRRPDVDHLRIFGSLAYVHIPKESADWHKILPRAFKGILTGYGGSGYRIFNPQTRRFAVTNHCTIYEGVKGALLLPSPDGSPAPSLPSLPSLEDISNQHEQNTVPTLAEDDFDDDEVLYGNTIIVAHPGDSPDLELGGDYSDIDSQPGGESPDRAS